MKGRVLGNQIMILVITIIFVLFSIFPVYWMISTSIKPTQQVFEDPPRWFPAPITTESYRSVFFSLNFPLYFWNTLRVSIISTFLSVAFAISAAYGFSRYRFRGHNQVMILMLVTQMFPLVLLVVPYMIILKNLNILNSDFGLVMAYTSFSLPFCTWMLVGFFNTISKELDDAAHIDGCGHISTLTRIIIPTILPGIGATVIFSFLNAWNQYLFPLVITTDVKKHTLPLAIASLMGQTRFQWNDIMAASTIASIPPLIVFLFLQKYFVKGMAEGAIK